MLATIRKKKKDNLRFLGRGRGEINLYKEIHVRAKSREAL